MSVPIESSNNFDEMERLAREHLRIIESGDEDAIEANITSDFFNLRSADEPIEARRQGPEAFKATIHWLQRAFTDMHFDIQEAAFRDNRVTLYVTFKARQHGPFVVYDSPDGKVTDVFPSTGRSLVVKQTHWFTIQDGAIAEHDAVRDDLAMAKQLGWIPPRPIYIARMMIALRKERRTSAVSKTNP